MRIVAFAAALLTATSAMAQSVDCTALGSHTTVCSNGVSYDRIGNVTVGSDGSTWTHTGSIITGPNGYTWTPAGNSLVGSDGTTCTRIGSLTNCHR